MLSAEERKERERCRKPFERRILTASEVVRRLGAVARPHNLDTVLAVLPRELIDPLKAQTSAFRPVRAVGYWCAPGSPPTRSSFRRPSDDTFPHPRRLVWPGCYPGDRRVVVDYLRSGHPYARWRGFSYCRFRCGIDSASMGSRCLTDGAWVWPEGLPHYVESHSVRLPEEFVRRIEEVGSRIPCDGVMPSYDTQGEPDYDFWTAWGQSTGA